MFKLQHWLDGLVKSQAGDIPRVSTGLRLTDIIGAIGVRMSIGRMKYSVKPGLYAVGSPQATSPVLVSANYKLSFDVLRSELSGMDLWLLVLDTRGINVWCAAGKGTFGTEELVSRIRSTNLEKVVTHRQLILPQLGAPGVAAHVVKKDSGFSVIYGPVRASDIKAFIEAGMKSSPEMRAVRFDLVDRVVVIPVELVEWFTWMLVLSFVMLTLSGITRAGYDFGLVCARGSRAAIIVMIAYLVGGIVTPCLLPWVPVRAFSFKGIWVGLALWVVLVFSGSVTGPGINGGLEAVAVLLIVCAITSFMAMNYTGTSTFTSQSGVKKEMRIFVPLQAIALVVGIGLWVTVGILL